jgi:hypothetical protein
MVQVVIGGVKPKISQHIMSKFWRRLLVQVDEIQLVHGGMTLKAKFARIKLREDSFIGNT